VPSSKDRQRIEIPTELYDRLKLIADSEERTLTSIVQDLLRLGLSNYQPVWAFRHYMSRLDEPAQRALALAREEAKRLNNNFVGTEHLLLAIEREGEGLAAGILQTLGALGKVREFTLAEMQRHKAQPVQSKQRVEQAAE